MDEPRRPTIGLFPKLIVAALAVFGLLTLLSWVWSWFFGLARILLAVAVVVLLVLWVASRSRRGDDA